MPRPTSTPSTATPEGAKAWALKMEADKLLTQMQYLTALLSADYAKALREQSGS